MEHLQQEVRIGFASIVISLALAPCVEPQTVRPQRPKLDIPFVVTADETVYQMLKLAGVKSRDTVYDLGCGDGRIVIAAARYFGARGVGVDLDPQRIRESRRNASKAGVDSLTKFYVQDLLKTDLRPATVVALYLGENMNLRLRPKLLQELRPGSRVVSHSFAMGDWKPDQTIKFTVGGKVVVVYCWVIPSAGPHADKTPRGS